MRILCAVQAILAAAFLLVGLVALFGLGVTGLLILVPGIVFAALAGLAQKRSRAGVLLTLAADSMFAYFVARRLLGALKGRFGLDGFGADLPVVHALNTVDLAIQALALLLVGCAVVAVVADWRALRASPWFWRA